MALGQKWYGIGTVWCPNVPEIGVVAKHDTQTRTSTRLAIQVGVKTNRQLLCSEPDPKMPKQATEADSTEVGN